MHICLLSQEWPPHGCGIGTYMYNVGRGLVAHGHQVSVITHDRDPVGLDGVQILQVPIPPRVGRIRRAIRRVTGLRHPWSLDALVAASRLKGVDLIETADFGAWGTHFQDDPKWPMYVRCHCPDYLVWRSNQLDPNAELPRSVRLQDRLERDQAVRADRLAAPSHAMAGRLSRAWDIPQDRFSVIPNPIDSDLFCPNGKTRGREILYVGRLEWNKGVFDLAEAVVPILHEYPDIRIRFVGMNLPTNEAMRLSGETAIDVIHGLIPEAFHNRLLFTSHVPVTQIIKMQHKALFAVVPTRGFESFSYTLLEAMACGTPVIATRCGGPEEIVTDGQDGLLVGPGKRDELTQAMRRLLLDSALRERLGAAGRRTVEARYSIPAVVPRIVSWYEGA